MRLFSPIRHLPFAGWTIGLLLLVLGILMPVSAHAQSAKDVYITPGSGTPGTLVTLVNTNPSFSFQCFANGIDLGYVGPSGSLGYTVPGDAVPGSSIDFRCYITNVDTTDSVGTFFVSDPPPVDTDGDGAPDAVDTCPTQYALTQNGCPDQPTPPDTDSDGLPDDKDACPTHYAQTANGCEDVPTTTDTDGDGAPDIIDACPTVFAQTQNGCPPDAQAQPTTAQQPVQPTATFQQIELSPFGECVVTPSGTAVNVREGPSLDAAVAARLEPGQTRAVLVTTTDRGWYQIEAGWVSATVTRLGGDCTTVPVVSYEFSSAAPIPTPVRMIVHLAPASYDMARLLDACPTLVEQARRLNFQALLQLAAIDDSTRRCDEALRLIQRAAFAAASRNPLLDEQNFTVWESTYCHLQEGLFDRTQTVGAASATYNNFILALLRVDADLADAHFGSPGSGSTFDQTWSITGANIACDIFRLNFSHVPDVAGYSGLGDNEMLIMAVVGCPQAFTLDTQRIRTTIIQLIRAGFHGADLLRDGEHCDLIREVHGLGTLSTSELFLYSWLVQTCRLNRYRQPIYSYDLDETFDMSAANLISVSSRVAADLYALMANDPSSLCRAPLDIIQSYGFTDRQQRADAEQETAFAFYTPDSFLDCPQNFRLIRRHGEELSPAALLSLLRSANPCQTAYQFATSGTGIPLNLGAASVCITGQTIAIPGLSGTTQIQFGGDVPIRPDAPLGSIVYPDRVVTQSNEFIVKLGAVDQDVNTICRGTTVTNLQAIIIPTPTLDFTSTEFTSFDLSTFDLSSLEIQSGIEAGAPPELPGGSSDAGVTPVPPDASTPPSPGGATVPPSASTPVPPSGGSAPLPTRAPASGGDSAAPTIAPATSVAMLPPRSAEDTAEMRASLDTLLHDAGISSEASGILGVFQAAPNGSTPTDLYLLTTAGIQPLTPNSLPNETLPALNADGTLVAFISQDTTGAASLQLIDLTSNAQSTLLKSSPEWTIAPFAPAWSPDGAFLLVTLLDSSSRQGIYLLDMSAPSVIPTLLVQDAAEPVITADGGYIAYTQGTPTRRDVVVKQLSSGLPLPITEQPEGSVCASPSFDSSGITLYFSCSENGQMEVYRYNLDGVNLLPVGTESVGDAVAGPNLNTLILSNGTTISVLHFGDAAPTTTPLVTLVNQQVSNFRWRAYRLAAAS